MHVSFSHFLKDESGAVTVDFVVLTAAMVVFGVAVVGTIMQGATDPAVGLGACLADIENCSP